MKKFFPVALLAFALIGCNNESANTNETDNKTEVSEKPQEENEQVIDVKKAEDNKENSDKNASANPDEAENEESAPTKDADEDIKDKENDKEETDNKESDNEDSKDKDDKESKVSKEDLFFLPYGSFRKVGENGELVDENDIVSPSDESYHYDYVKYSNNMFVRMKRNVEDLNDKVAIVRMNDKDVTKLYEFPDTEDFHPLGLIGDRVYGFHIYNEHSEINGTPTLEEKKSALAYVDLANGNVEDYQDTVDVLTGGAVVIDGKLQFTKPGDNAKEDVYNYDLYQLDLSKGVDQEAELVEKDFNLQYLFGQKRFVDGSPVWKIIRADNDNIYANDQKFPFLWAEAGSQEIIGNNIFYFPLDPSGSEGLDILTSKIKVINMTTGETVLDTVVRGIKIAGNKLYYLNTNNELESVDIEL